jgi:hypothetical protein
MPSFRRLFHSSPSSPSVSDDLADLEECFRNNSFALLPSALTPSRAPSNSVIAAIRAPFFNKPVRLDFTSGLEKGPVGAWYKTQNAKFSTAIKKIQLRKDYQHPYYHEYIIISTKSGHTYRVDRRPDPDAPFDTIMKIGCIAYDTIQELDSTSLKELDNTSRCVVELRWQGTETIDLIFVLSICFAVQNDTLADRYTLQRYNCYFLSWAIIGITMRKSVVRGAVFNTSRPARGLVRGPALERERELELELELEWELERELELELEQALKLKRELERELMLVRELERERVLVLVRERERGWELDLERAWKRKRALELDLEWAQERARERELELELELEQAWKQERALGLEQAQEWAHGLGQIPLVLGPMKYFALPKTSRQVRLMTSLLYGLIYFNIA